MRRTHHLLLPALLLLAGCPGADCPGDDVAVEGACYPAEAVAQVDGGVPTLCVPACADGLHCDYTTGTCGECAVDAHCPDRLAPTCDATEGLCAPCTSDAACASRAETPYCDTLTGTCGACTPENESIVCGAHSCDVLSGRCTTTPRGSRAACETCRADSECGGSMRCVEFSFFGLDPEFVCLFDRADVVCATSAVSPIAPYVKPALASTLRGEIVDICQPPSSCDAMRDYVAGTTCRFASECGGPPGASFCPGSGSARPGVCTVWCASTVEGYEGCLGGDVCNGSYCEPAL